MNVKNLLMTVGIGVWMSVSGSVFAQSNSTPGEKKDLLQTLEAEGTFKTLAAALEKTNLGPTLQSEGPFTVFAPSDEAFAKLDQSTLDSLMANPEMLKSILLYHVVAGKVSSQEAVQAGEAATVNGAKVTIKADDTGIMVNEARVTKADIEASNGVIHVVDTVLTPPAAGQAKDIVSIISADGRFKMLSQALQAADLVSKLQSAGPFTVFAPTDAAVAKLGQKVLQEIQADKMKLTNILLYHVIQGAAVDFESASKLTEAEAANGQKLKISYADGVLRINDAIVTVKDIKATNGIIHVIDSVLLPQAQSPAQGSSESEAKTL